MSAASAPALPYDPATVQFDPLLRRLNLANTRRHWQRLLDRAETHGWSCREFLGVLVTEEVAHRQETRIQRSVRQARFPFPEDRTRHLDLSAQDAHDGLHQPARISGNQPAESPEPTIIG